MSGHAIESGPVSYFAFQRAPLQSEFAPLAALGNVVPVLSSQQADFLAAANPATLERLVDQHHPATAERLGRLVTRQLYLGEARDVTAAATELIAGTQGLIQELPTGFRADFVPDSAELPPLRVQKTADGDLLVGFAMDSSQLIDAQDGTYLSYALFGADGVLRDSSEAYVYQFDATGRRIASESAFVQDMAARLPLTFWMDYLPPVAQVLRAYQAGDTVVVREHLAAVYASMRRDRPVSPPAFLDDLDSATLRGLTKFGRLPNDFIAPRLPSESVLDEMYFSSVANITEALERWGIPYTEVHYTAGAREVGSASVRYEQAYGQLSADFRIGRELLSAEFRPLAVRNRHDLYARVLVADDNGETHEQEILLHDGTRCRLAGPDYADEITGHFTVPRAVREYLAQMPQPEVLRKEAIRPSRQLLRIGAGIGRGLELQHSAAGDQYIMLGGRQLVLPPAVANRMENVRVRGTGTFVSFLQEITVEYYRIADQLVPVVVDVAHIQQHDESKVE